MRKLTVVLVAALLLAFAATSIPAHAAFTPPCGDQQDPNTPSGFCRPLYIGGEPVTLKDGVPFAWLRSQPQSPQIAATVWPNANATMQIAYGPQGHFDGFQWWWFVTLAPSGQPYLTGWVEQASLRTISIVPDDPTVMKEWRVPLTAQVKAGIPFVWMRTAPSSEAPPAYTIPPLGRFVVIGYPHFDGVQWWWMVAYQEPYRYVFGYVEQGSIQPLTR